MMMLTTAGVIAALASACGGFTALSLAMDRHWEALHGRGNVPTDQQRRALRWSGGAGLLVSLLVCIYLWGASQGWVARAGVSTAAAVSLVLTLTYGARAIVRVGWMAGAVAVLAVAAIVIGGVLS